MNRAYRFTASAPKTNKEKKVEITPDPKNNETTDLQTVFAELARQYNQVKFCDSRMEVLTANAALTLSSKTRVKKNWHPTSFLPATGTASKCSMYIDKLGSEGDDLLWQFTSDRPIYFWILASGKNRHSVYCPHRGRRNPARQNECLHSQHNH